MMSSCLSGGGTTIPPYGFHHHHHLDLLNSTTRSSPSSSSPASSSLTSTLSDSTTSPLLSVSVSVSIRKPRSTPRKRPNQTYYEAAALLSSACPNLFSPSPPPLLTHRPPSSSPHHSPPSPELFLPFRILHHESAFLIRHPSQDQKLLSFLKDTRPCQTPDDGEIQSKVNKAAQLHDEYDEDFDAESMLDEELEEGIIDSIMGEKTGSREAEKSQPGEGEALKLGPSFCRRRNPMELLGLGGRLGLCYHGHGIRKAGGGSGWRDDGQVNWCNFLTVDVNEISPKLKPNPVPRPCKNNSVAEKRKKKVEKARPAGDELGFPATATMGLGLGVKKMLNLDYDKVLEAWTGKGRGSPFPDDTPASDVAGRVDEVMELIVEGMRHKEKIRTTTKKKMR